MATKKRGLPCGFTRTKTIGGERYRYSGIGYKKSHAEAECKDVRRTNRKNKCRVVPKRCVGLNSKKNKLVGKTVYGVYTRRSR
jgi:hypothetical protein